MFRKLFSFSVLAVLAIWELFLQPIWNLNVERWAEKRSLDFAVDGAARPGPDINMPAWLVEWVTYLTGDFLDGAAFVAVVILIADGARWSVQKVRGRPTAKSLKALTMDIYHLHGKMNAERTRLANRDRTRIRSDTPLTISIELENKFRSLMYELARHEVHTPELSGRFYQRSATVACDFLATVAPYIQRGQLAEAQVHAKKFVQQVKDEEMKRQSKQSTG